MQSSINRTPAQEIAKTIGRDPSPYLTLNPPFFKDVSNAVRAKAPKFNRLIANVRRVL